MTSVTLNIAQICEIMKTSTPDGIVCLWNMLDTVTQLEIANAPGYVGEKMA